MPGTPRLGANCHKGKLDKKNLLHTLFWAGCLVCKTFPRRKTGHGLMGFGAQKILRRKKEKEMDF